MKTPDKVPNRTKEIDLNSRCNPEKLSEYKNAQNTLYLDVKQNTF